MLRRAQAYCDPGLISEASYKPRVAPRPLPLPTPARPAQVVVPLLRFSMLALSGIEVARPTHLPLLRAAACPTAYFCASQPCWSRAITTVRRAARPAPALASARRRALPRSGKMFELTDSLGRKLFETITISLVCPACLLTEEPEKCAAPSDAPGPAPPDQPLCAAQMYT